MGRHAASKTTKSRLWIASGLALFLAATTALIVTWLANDGSGQHASAHEAPTTITAQESSAAPARCASQLRVVTAASYAPVLNQVGQSLASGSNCVAMHITVADGVGAAAIVASSGADVWISDDQSWPRFAANDLRLADDDGSVLASSPMYLVTLRSGPPLPSTARSLVGLGEALGKPGGWSLTVRDPAAAGDGMVAAGDIATALGDAAGPLVSALDMMRAWQHATTSSAPAAAFPTRSNQVALIAEYALLASTHLQDYTITAPTDRPVLMRYSWSPTAAAVADPGKSAALGRLHQALVGPAATTALADADLRGPTWPAAPPASAVQAGLPAVSGTPMPVLSEHWMYHVLSTWNPSLRRANVLIVVDVSGSMADAAPGTGTAKIDLVRQGLTQAVALWPDSSRVGVWQFGSQLAPPNDWQSLVPIANLTAAQRAAIAQTTTKLHARPTGTGLYNTILAAYRQVQTDYQADIPNEVLVFTDGIDQDDPTSISLAHLKAGLAATDPAKRVQLSIFGFGGAVPADAMSAALAPVGGQVDQLANADETIGAFVHAVSGGLSGYPG